MQGSPERRTTTGTAWRRSVAGRLAVATLAATFVLVGPMPALGPPVARAASVKVVVIVGPVEGLTDSYRAWGEKVAKTAESYGADVRRVYSPNATWKKVLDNIQDASIVVYMGHGNGFPSPYSSTLNPDKVDGFGLNDPDKLSDNVHLYRGESYIAQSVKLAPNAVVFLSHACYSAGSSESWDTDPTVSVARQRVDNFAAGFIKAGARAVFALAHADPSPYVAKLFTTDQPVQTIFETAADWDGRWVRRFDSLRSPGFDETLDPTLDPRLDPPEPTYYLRSLVAWPGLTAGQVTGYDPDAPRLQNFAPQPAYLSPNADGVKDSVTFSGTWTTATDWRLEVRDAAGSTVFTSTGAGTALSAKWAGENGTAPADGGPLLVPDGVYRVVVDGQDADGHAAPTLSSTVTLDTGAPVVSAPTPRLGTGTMARSSVPVTSAWSSASLSPLAYQVQRQANGGSWASLSSSTTALAVSQSLAFGSTYRYRVSATDAAGNGSTYAYGPNFQPLRKQEGSSLVSYTGKWSTASSDSYSGGKARYSRSAGARATFTFNGWGVAWVASKGSTRGSADVYVDGVYRKTVSLYASSYKSKRLVFAANWAASGSHTLTVVVKGTAGHPRVDVDAFVVLRPV